jgi:sirohydrochlorin cobaltochelatase
MAQRGIILLAHGSRDPLWQVPIEAVASALRRRDSSALVGCAYLELSQPDLAQCAADLLTQGASQLTVFPLFLGVGKHAREDIPAQVAQLQARHPGVPVALMASAGEHPRLWELLADIALS